MNDIECPYCGHKQHICHDDGYGYEEDHLYEQECDGCEKIFGYITSISWSYNLHKVPCFNGEPHNLEGRVWRYLDYWHIRWACRECDFTRSEFPQHVAWVPSLETILEKTDD